MNDALVKMHLNSVQFAKNQGLSKQYVEHDVKAMQPMLQRMKGMIEKSGEKEIALVAIFERHLERRVAQEDQLRRIDLVAPQDGIFHVDLRMRPYGQAGAAAVRLDDFRNYYRADGPAWPYERQALVRLRPVAGDREFGDRVLSAASDCTYLAGSFDFVSMRAMRERQVRQLVRGGSINAKLSDGGLVDFEYAIQALQISFGRQYPTLRHSNTLRVLQEATRLKLISEKQCHELERTYVFLRELIDCLRMARGNAKDLTLPATGTRDWEQLSRRMQSIHDSEIPLESLESQMHQVREFSRQIEEMCRQKTV